MKKKKFIFILFDIITYIFIGGLAGIGYFWLLASQYPEWNILSRVYISMFIASLTGGLIAFYQITNRKNEQ